MSASLSRMFSLYIALVVSSRLLQRKKNFAYLFPYLGLVRQVTENVSCLFSLSIKRALELCLIRCCANGQWSSTPNSRRNSTKEMLKFDYSYTHDFL